MFGGRVSLFMVIFLALYARGQETRNLAEVLSAEGFSKLVELVVAAGLADTVSNGGPFTVFAPTNEAFEALDPSLVNSLVADPERLKNVLLYHVVAGNVMSSDLSNGIVNSAQGAPLKIGVGEQVTVNDVAVTRADIPARNGVVHVIDQVLLPPVNLAETLTSRGFSQLVDLVVRAGLADTVSNGGPFTVFAPTNEAFAALDPELVNSLVADPERLKNVILYHVVAGNVLSTDLKSGLVNSAEGTSLKINVGSQVTVNGVPVTQADLLASNGVVHVIDQVLLPPGNLAEALSSRGFSQLVDLVVKAGLAETVSNGGPFTIFAPTNEAFEALDKAVVDSLLADPELLKSVLLYHVVPGSVVSSDLGNDLLVDTAQGTPVRVNLFFSNNAHFATVNGAVVTEADLPATNGVIHVIDKVLTPPSGDIVQTLVADPKFSTLVAAAQAAGLVETLSSDGPFTVFAPTNEAFDKLPAGTVGGLLKDVPALRKILLRHVISGETYYSKALCWRTYGTAGGDDITSYRDRFYQPRVRTDNGEAKVIEPDTSATNGVIHAIDTVV